MAKIGRRRKYETARAFARAVDGYFASISYFAPIETEVPRMRQDPKTGYDVPVRDADGHVVYEKVPVLTEDGKEAKVRQWIEAPSITGLCLYLGFSGSRETWRQYAAREEYAEVCEMAKSRVEEYLTQQLGGKGANGAKFALEHNFNWKERVEHSLDEKTAKAVSTAKMTIEEKQAYLQELLQAEGGLYDV